MLRSMLPLVMGIALAAAVLAGASGVFADPPFDNAQHHDIKLVGTNDLQARSTYQPTLHKYPDGRYILFTGHHSLGTNPVTGDPLPSFNPLTGKNEPNGTSLVDVTDPENPVLLFHIPVGTPVNPPATPTAGGAQMVRVCDGRTLPIGNNRVYMLRTYTGSATNTSAHEIWDVTNPSQPVGVHTVAGGNPVLGGLQDTHKSWWECDSGIAYIVGRRGNDTANHWRPGNHIMIMDLSDPEAASLPFLRDWALDGQQNDALPLPYGFTVIPAIHGPISTGPSAGHVIPGNSSNPVAGTGATLDRVYFAYGIGANGVMQIVDRTKLLPQPWGTGIRCGSATSTTGGPASCTAADFKSAEIGRLVMNPDNGAHTSWPLGTITVPDFVTDTGNDDGFTTRDIVVVVSEAGGAFCNQFRHLTFLTDVTTESRPQVISTAQVPASEGDFCNKGGRFGPHASNEEFGPPFYQKLTFISYFNAGVRAFDVRDPYDPVNVAFFIPAVTDNTDLRCGTLRGVPNVCPQVIQTNNVATDDRGCIYIVDRADTGLHVLQLEGESKKIIGGLECKR